MKVRAGFVSNSSSSSFIVYGAWIDKDVIKSKLSKEDLKYIEDEGEWAIAECAEGIPMFQHYENDRAEGVFGRGFSSIGDDETGKEFRKSVEKKLEELFGKKIKCDTIHHTYSC